MENFYAKFENIIKEMLEIFLFSVKKSKNYITSGYTLFAPLFSKDTYLIDGKGNVVHIWNSQYPPANSVYLLENGNLLRTSSPGINVNRSIRTTGTGFYVQEISLKGKVLWNFRYSDNKYRLHHDIEPLPNGNILMLVYEKKTAKEAIAAGRKPELLKEGFLLSECVVEVKPKEFEGGEIVWSWRLWDHLIQDYDPLKTNHGDVARHPELLDINFVSNKKPDWVHFNSIGYNREIDQILLTSRTLSEVWVIDHSTSESEANGHKGGRSGKGGDILYRWGNPQVYKHGAGKDQKLFGPHDAQWIKKGFLGEGNMLIFNNGDGRPEREYSSVEEIIPPMDSRRNYLIYNKNPFGPDSPVWFFSVKEDGRHFYSQHLSGAQRLNNGNTLICVGGRGYFFEITPEGKQAWSYQNIFYKDAIYKKNIIESRKYTTSKPGQSSRKKEAVFSARRYSSFGKSIRPKN